MKRIAIIGFGGAGYSAAREIRRLDPRAVIDVYSDTDTGPYNPMLTTYYVKDSLPYEGMFPFGTLEEIAGTLDLNVNCRTPVTGLVPGERKIMLSDGRRKVYDEILKIASFPNSCLKKKLSWKRSTAAWPNSPDTNTKQGTDTNCSTPSFASTFSK